ncbi:amino acid permease-domain-containing protein [Pisolithus croceorrhizus]|nr:amino acid permease-domain-containing protein [Pisolithus croceorrhizus]
MSGEEEIAKRDEETLAQLGYKQEFKREFTPLEISACLRHTQWWPAAMVWGWLVASTVILSTGLSIAELASAAPTAGGLLLDSFFGIPSLAQPSLLASWVVRFRTADANATGYIAGVAAVDWSCAIQITAAMSIGSGQAYIATNAQIYNFHPSKGTKDLHRRQHLVRICLYGWPEGFTFILSFMAPLWTVSGFDATVHISEEASNAAVTVPWAIVCSGITGILLGWAINVTLAFCMGTDIGYLLSSPIGQPMAQIFFNSFGQKGTLVLWVLVIHDGIELCRSATFVFLMVLMLDILSRVNKSTSVPINAVWFVIFCAALLGLLAFAGTQAIGAVFTLGISAAYVAYTIAIAARWLGDNNFKRGPFHLGNFSLPISIIAVLFMPFMDIIFLLPTTPSTSATTMNYTIVVLGGVLGLSLVWYYLPVYGGVHWFTGPVPNIRRRDGDNQDLDTRNESGEEGVKGPLGA